MEWFYSWSIDIKKRACCYLIQRYFGKYFKQKLNLGQLSVDLYNGTATVMDLRLDCEGLNELFSQHNLPIEIVYGYISRISITIPWSQLLRESSHIEIEGLKLRVRTTTYVDNGSLILGSMLSSMTLSSSQNAAEDYFRREESCSVSDQKSKIEGIEKFAQTIDSILNRIVILLKYSEIHFEQQCDNENSVSLQFNIETINYLDESDDGNDVTNENPPINTKSPSKNVSLIPSNLYSSKRVLIERIQIYINEIGPLNTIESHVLIGHFTECQEIRLKTKLSDEVNDVKLSFDVIFSSLFLYMDPKSFNKFYDILMNFLNRNFQNSSNKTNNNVSKSKPLTELDNNMIERDLQQQINSSIFMENFSKRHVLGGWSTAANDNAFDDMCLESEMEFFPMNRGAKMSNSVTSIADSLASDAASSVISTNTASMYTTAESSYNQKSLNVEDTLSSSTIDFSVKFKDISVVVVEDFVCNQSVKTEFMSQNHLRFDMTSLSVKGSQRSTKNSKTVLSLLVNISKFELCEYLWNGETEICEKITILSTSNDVDGSSIEIKCDHCSKYSQRNSKDCSNSEIIVESKDLFTEIDFTILDRISNIMNLLSNGSKKSDGIAEQPDELKSKKSTNIKIKSPKLTIKLRLPIADLRPFDEIELHPKWYRSIHDDYLLLTIDNAMLKTGLNSNNVQCLKFDLLCSEIRVDYMNRPLAQLCSLGNPKSAGTSVPQISIVCNYASPVPVPKRAQNPFSDTKTMHEGQEIILPAEQSEIKEFISFGKRNASIYVLVSAPKFFMRIESKSILDMLYNRIGSHLLLWETIERKRRKIFDLNKVPEKKFTRCRSRILYESDDEDSDDNDNDFSDDKSCHDFRNVISQMEQKKSFFGLQFDVGSGVLSLLSKLDDDTFDELRLITSQTTLFLVTEYQGDPSLSLFTIESKTFNLYHCGETLSIDQLESQKMHEYQKIDKYLKLILSHCPQSLDIFNQKQNREMLTIVACFQTIDPTKKNITLSIGLNETLMQYHMTTVGRRFWLMRLLEFFDISDYSIEGYKAKTSFTNLYVHLWNCCIDYKPVYLSSKCLLTINYFVMNSTLATRVKSSVLKFMFEDCALFLSCNETKDCVKYDFETDYVCLVDLNVFELILNMTSKIDSKFPEPLVDFKASSKLINIRTCSDSASALMELVVYFASDGDLKNPNRTARSSVSESADIQVVQPMQDQGQHDSGLSSLESEKLEQLSSLLCDAIDEDHFGNGKNVHRTSNTGKNVFNFPEDSNIRKSPVETVKYGSSSEIENDFCFLDYNKDDKFVPKTAHLNDTVSNLTEEHFSSTLLEADLSQTPKKYSRPILQYTLSEISIKWTIYSGNDFSSKDKTSKSATNSPKPKPKSTFAYSDRILLNEYTPKRKTYNEIRHCGGINRDYNTCMEIVINKLRFQHVVFSRSKKEASRQVLLISKFEILDLLASSEINKFLYEYSSSAMPKQTNSNMLKIRAVHVRPDLNSNMTECSLKISLSPLRFNIDQDSILFLNQFFTNLTNSDQSDMENCSANLVKSSPIHRPPVLNMSVDKPLCKLMDENSSSDDSSSEMTNVEESHDTDMFFKTVVFSPSVPIKLDYHGKHVDMSFGNFTGLLIGLTNLNNSEFLLKRICYRHGILGVQKLVSFICNQWLTDIRSQLHYILGGVGPIYSIVQLIQGIRDLFFMPIEQYRKDGRIIRGIQRGAFSFTTCTAMAFLELTSRLVNLIQSTAETAYDIVSSGPSIQKLKKNKKRPKKKHHHPQDIREGCHNAFLVVKEGFGQTAQDIVQIAAHEHEQKGYTGAVGGIIRQIPPTIVKPIIIASEATNNVLGGFKSQLVPDARLEANEKWRNK